MQGERASTGMYGRRVGRRVALAALASLIAFAVTAAAASAVIVHLPGKTLSYQPLRTAHTLTFDKFFSNLDYNGGPVMPSNTNYTIYWQPSGAPSYPAGYETGVNEYLENLAHDSGGTQKRGLRLGAVQRRGRAVRELQLAFRRLPDRH